MIRIILSGCLGKMGHMLTEEAAKDPAFTIVAGVDAMAQASDQPYPVYTDIARCREEADVVIDFSRPDALPMLLRYAQKTGTALVLASTGYNKNDIASIEIASENVPIMRSANMSRGINLLKQLASEASSVLNSTFDIEILEKHHNTKVDAPSGTAMMLADAVNEAAGGDLEYVFDRHERREARPKRELGLHAIRGGNITGEHTVIFAGPDEVVELTHQAYSRRIYALGALKAAEFIIGLPCGLYDMSSMMTQKQIITNAYAVEGDVLISVSGVTDYSHINQIFSALKESDIIVDIISQPTPTGGAFSLSLSVQQTMADKAMRLIRDITDEETVELISDVSKVTVEGSGMAHHAGAAGDVIGMLCKMNVPIYLITTSETKITCCVPKTDTQRALAALKECFTQEK